MIADRVRVRTRSYTEESGWEWESDGTRQLHGHARRGPLPRGTEVILHLKDDAKDFAADVADQGDRPAILQLRPVSDPAGAGGRGPQRPEADLGRAQEPGHRGAVHAVLPAPDPPPRGEAALAPPPGGRLADPVPRDRLLPADEPRAAGLRPARARAEPLRQAGAGAARVPRAGARVPAVPPRAGRFRGPAAERLARDAPGQQRHPADPHLARQGRARPARQPRRRRSPRRSGRSTASSARCSRRA